MGTTVGNRLRLIGCSALNATFVAFIIISHDQLGSAVFPITFLLTLFMCLVITNRRLSPMHGSNFLHISALNTIISTGAIIVFFLTMKIPRLPPPELVSTAPSQAPTSAPTQSIDYLPIPPPPGTQECSFVNYDPSLSTIASTTASTNNNLNEAYLVYRSGCPHIHQNETLEDIVSYRFGNIDKLLTL